METQHFSIRVNAPAEVVWKTMFDHNTYRQWTSVFNPDSYFEGAWLPGSEIRFLGSNPDGGMNGLTGMFGVITEHRPYEFVLIEYQGQIVNDIDDTTSREARQLIGAREAYSFLEADGATTVTIDVDTADTYAELFGELWPRGLAKLKELAEAAAAEPGPAHT
ncbi:SRPBCC domain-containing protein [Cryobacterium sp. SO2]|uniref:SRPBCC domain-containing protein n=1 Tax=Cryobacterium sp. SO2 TaxID=1897060 RepID=UPI00223DC953|nr:SRPBCC domain-containing protein [Cryobacterium sp. SO2]WEO77365.1 SRPBCC domain-containing protein [Cryobacterium sp. SO2]